jgi:hypothetical protein
LSKQIIKYFKRKSSKWSILDYLAECGEKHFHKSIDKYVKSLENIINYKKLGRRHDKARELLKRYKEASK